MKKQTTFFLIPFIIFSCIVFLGMGKTNKRNILSVTDIAADPFAYEGLITVNGIIAASDQNKPDTFTMIETKEAVLCKGTHCAAFYLPVKYESGNFNSNMEVNVTGTISEDGKILVAKNIKVIKTHYFPD